MKFSFKILLFLFYFGSLSCAIAQVNLVPNPSFELYDTCPNSLGQINYALGWGAFMETPDYYNGCAGSFCSTPYNYAGYQQAASGNAYCAIQAYSYMTDIHEIVGSSLTSSLNVGERYFVTFKVVNAGIIAGPGFNCFTNKLGVRFSTVSYSNSNPAPINNFAQIYTDSIIKDTVNWYTISGSFIADSSYQYLSIGNFFQDVNTDTIKLNSWAARAYYLVDDICVSVDSIYASTWTSTDELKKEQLTTNLFPNPTDGNTHISYLSNKIPLVSVYNTLGERMNFKMINSQNHIEFDLNELEAGIYYIYILIDEKKYVKKVVKL
jgi:Secretion system C-terminal sorting domain